MTFNNFITLFTLLHALASSKNMNFVVFHMFICTYKHAYYACRYIRFLESYYVRTYVCRCINSYKYFIRKALMVEKSDEYDKWLAICQSFPFQYFSYEGYNQFVKV